MPTSAASSNHKCFCGCGDTPDNHSQFVPGHDGKLRHVLTEVMKGNAEVSTIPKIVIENRADIAMIQNDEELKSLVNKAARGRS